MYRYLRGIYKGKAGGGAVLIEVSGVGYEVLVPPLVEEAISASFDEDMPLVLHVSAQSSRDQPWPQLFGFLRPEERDFWELLITVPRLGGKSAVRAMAAPIAQIAQAIQDGNRVALDALPGITLEGAEKMIASLRKKVAPFVQPVEAGGAARRRPLSAEEEMRDDAVQLLTVMGIKRQDAQKAVDQILATREEAGITSVQDIVTTFLRTYQQSSARA